MGNNLTNQISLSVFHVVIQRFDESGVTRKVKSEDALQIRRMKPAAQCRTMVQNNQEFRQKYWATRSSVRLLVFSTPLLTSLSTLLRSLAHSLADTLTLSLVGQLMI